MKKGEYGMQISQFALQSLRGGASPTVRSLTRAWERGNSLVGALRKVGYNHL
jgi:hypothetical protein